MNGAPFYVRPWEEGIYFSYYIKIAEFFLYRKIHQILLHRFGNYATISLSSIQVSVPERQRGQMYFYNGQSSCNMR